MNMLRKEWVLCMHPTGYIMPLGALLILVPGYPYGVCCFYTGLAIYFICLTARENRDAAFTLTLPVSRRDMVRGRILLSVLLEVATLLLMAVFILLKKALGNAPNPAGLDAGVATIGEGLLLFAFFNMIFFPNYYKDINKPGKAFLLASSVLFLWIIAEIIGTYTAPFLRDVLDRPDPEHMRDKLLFSLGGLALFAASIPVSIQHSAKKLEEQDLTL